MKTRVRTTGKIKWIPRADPVVEAELDKKYKRIKGKLQWDTSVPVNQPELPLGGEDEDDNTGMATE